MHVGGMKSVFQETPTALSVRDQVAFNKKIELKVAHLASAAKAVVSPNSVENVNAVTTRGGKITRDAPYPNHKTGKAPRQ